MNKVIKGVVGVARPRAFARASLNSLTSHLNYAQIVSFVFRRRIKRLRISIEDSTM